MPLTVVNVVEHMYRYLAKEQRAIPFVPEDHPDLEDPLPEALAAINGALQQMAVFCPVFAARQLRSAFFHAPVTLTVSGLTNGAKTMPEPEGWQSWMAGCAIQLPGDGQVNRLLATDGETVTLQFPHLSSETGGSAGVSGDLAVLDTDIIQVLPGVRSRSGVLLYPAGSRADLRQPGRVARSDYGRAPGSLRDFGISYCIESMLTPGAPAPRLGMILQPAPDADLAIEFEARTSLGWFTADDVEGETATYVPVPAQFVESIFLPVALWRFFGSSVMRNVDAPRYIEQQAAAAEKLLQGMRPQTDKKANFKPTW